MQIGNRMPELARDDLICIEMQHPQMLQAAFFKRKISLRGEVLEVVTQNTDTALLRDLHGLISAPRIDNEDIVAPLQRVEAPWQVRRLVVRKQDYRDLHLVSSGGRRPIGLHGFPATMVQAPTSV